MKNKKRKRGMSPSLAAPYSPEVVLPLVKDTNVFTIKGSNSNGTATTSNNPYEPVGSRLPKKSKVDHDQIMLILLAVMVGTLLLGVLYIGISWINTMVHTYGWFRLPVS